MKKVFRDTLESNFGVPEPSPVHPPSSPTWNIVTSISSVYSTRSRILETSHTDQRLWTC